ncbi:MAG TPA: hypothetical protein VGM03_04845 [Phycisphaerae bacterium]|jgi:hypothetical protein
MLNAHAAIRSEGDLSEASTGDLAQRRRVQAARRRVLLFGAALVCLAVLLVGLMAWQRDTLRIERARSIAARYARALETFTGSDGRWPATFPVLGLTPVDSNVAAAMTYVGPKSALHTPAGQQVLAYSNSVDSFVHARGRAIIVADGARLRIEWVSEAQFRQMGGASVAPGPSR